MPDLKSIDKVIRTACNAELSKSFDKCAAGYDGIVIAGASGWVSKHTLQGLERAGIRPKAFADNNPGLWGSKVQDILVVDPKQAIADYPDAVFVAAIFTHTPLRGQLTKLGAKRVVSYAQLFHKLPAAFLPYFAISDPVPIADQADRVREAAGVWADDESRELYAGLLNWFVTLESGSVPGPLPANRTHFSDVLRLLDDEVFVDCGAFDGDTISSYVDLTGGRYRRILALEPDPQTFLELNSRIRNVERITTLNVAVGAELGRLPFVAAGSLASHAVSAGAEGVSISGSVIHANVIRLDDVKPRPTYIKMDIEGFEREALEGGRRLLASNETAFAVTLYHRMADLWNLPLYIHEAAPDLKLFLRHYAEDWSETVCYAIPQDRLVIQEN